MAILRNTVLIILTLITLLGWLCWLYAGQILHQLARPQIEEILARQLTAEVSIGRLAWTEQGLRANELSIQRAPDLQLQVAQIDIYFTLSGLWQKRLQRVQISAPELRLQPSEAQRHDGEPPPTLPEKFPLQIDSLSLTDGVVLLQMPERTISIRDIDFFGALESALDFQISAGIGAKVPQVVAVKGRLGLARQATLQLDRILLNRQSLLDDPLSLSFSSADLTLGGGLIRVGHFDQLQLRNILTALGQTYPLPDELSFTLQESEIAFRLSGAASSARIRVKQGEIIQQNLKLPFRLDNLEISLSDSGWLAKAELHGPAGLTLSVSSRPDAEGIAGQAEIEIPYPDRLKTELLGGSPIGLSGSLRIGADYAIAAQQLQLFATLRGQSGKDSQDALFNLAKLNGTLKLAISAQQEQLALELKTAQRALLSASGTLQRLDFLLSLADRQQLAALLATDLLPPQLAGFSGLAISGQIQSAKAEGWQGRLDLTSQSADFANLDLRQVKAQAKLKLNTKRLKVTAADLTAALSRGEEFSGQLNGRFSGEFSADSFQLDLEQLALQQANYLGKLGRYGLGNGQLKLAGQVSGKRPWQQLDLELSGRAAADELLAGALYADLSALPAQFSLTGQLDPARQELAATHLEIALPGLAKVTTRGQVSAKQIILHSTTEFVDLAASHAEMVVPILAQLQPRAADLKVTGQLSVATELYWTPRGWQAFGAIRPQGLDVLWDYYRLKMIAGTGQIPYSLQQGSPPPLPKTQAERTGEISFSTLAFGLASLQGGILDLAATPNRFAFRSPLHLQLAGGQVTVAELSFGWSETGPQGSVRIGVRDVDLALLTAELDLPLMEGGFTADLGQLHYADQELTSQGTASLEIFNGRVLLQNMRYSKPFSRYPIFHADIDVFGLDLLAATRTFEFGEMNGVVDGYLHNLRLFGTTPSAFEAQFSTRDQGKRNISVKALQNLSIISQGGISAALSRGIYRFIDFYRYKKIGFVCALENDIFTLIGTARPASKRYLVYGGLLPPRIDITTSSPTISFKEMVGRLSRIERAAN